MKLFDGKKEAEKLEQRITDYLNINPVEAVLLVVMIGDNKESEKYVNLKKKVCERLGINIKIEMIDDSLGDSIIIGKVKKLFGAKNIKGGIIQLPLPRKSLQKALDAIPFDKDTDMISSNTLTRYYSNKPVKPSPVVRSFEHFISYNRIDLENINCAVIGAGELVGRPLAHYLDNKKAKVVIFDDDSLYKNGEFLNFDLIVLSSGSANLIKGENLKGGCALVDFGSSVVEGKTVGDLDLNSELDHLGVISPSPGGMGPLVIRYLIMNFLGL